MLMCHKTDGWVANIVDPDQMPHYVMFDLGLHCLLRPVSQYLGLLWYYGNTALIAMVSAQMFGCLLFHSVTKIRYFV